MEFQVINRNRNAVIPEGMFKLCGMEDAKLISMVQLNGGILLMPESVSTYQLLMLIDALNEQACEFLEAVAAECGPAEAEHRDMTLDEVLREFTVAVPDRRDRSPRRPHTPPPENFAGWKGGSVRRPKGSRPVREEPQQASEDRQSHSGLC